MRQIAELSSAELIARLKHPGIYVRTGPFTIHIQTPLPILAHMLGLLYADFCLEANDSFADFHVRLIPSRNVRCWWCPQVLFFSDGISYFQPLARDLAFPLLEWGLNWCVVRSAHQYLIIHAAVVERDGHVLIFPAPPGSGKSTLCAALVHRGWRLLSDELALVCPTAGRIQPLPRPIALKGASIQVIRDFAPHALIGPEHVNTRKGTIAHVRPPTESIARAEQTAAPAWIVFPSYKTDSPTQLTPWPKARAFMRVADQAFNYSVLGAQGFETMAHLIAACDCFTFTYGDLDEAVTCLTNLERPRCAA